VPLPGRATFLDLGGSRDPPSRSPPEGPPPGPERARTDPVRRRVGARVRSPRVPEPAPSEGSSGSLLRRAGGPRGGPLEAPSRSLTGATGRRSDRSRRSRAGPRDRVRVDARRFGSTRLRGPEVGPARLAHDEPKGPFEVPERTRTGPREEARRRPAEVAAGLRGGPVRTAPAPVRDRAEPSRSDRCSGPVGAGRRSLDGDEPEARVEVPSRRRRGRRRRAGDAARIARDGPEPAPCPVRPIRAKVGSSRPQRVGTRVPRGSPGTSRRAPSRSPNEPGPTPRGGAQAPR
jgi:hypothetical protein